MSGDVKKVVLAYSGGLDTSVILKWLQTEYGCEVVAFTTFLTSPLNAAVRLSPLIGYRIFGLCSILIIKGTRYLIVLIK